MNIYDMMKSGMSQEEIFNAFKQESKKAREVIAAEAQAAENEARSAALKAEARAHLVNAILGYADAFGLDLDFDNEDIDEFETFLIDAEDQIEMVIPVIKSLLELNKKLDETEIDNSQNKSTKVFKVAADLDPEAMNEILRNFLEGLN